MTVANEHIAHHRRVCRLYKELLQGVEEITLHENPSLRYDSNYWLNTVILDSDLHVTGEEKTYQKAVQGAIGGERSLSPMSNKPLPDYSRKHH